LFIVKRAVQLHVDPAFPKLLDDGVRGFVAFVRTDRDPHG
jgi:hypothetical protein